MLECHITSVEVWVQRLHEQPFYALLCGFAPDDGPGVGTFDEFQDRVLQMAQPVLDQVCCPRRRSEQRKKSETLRDKNNTAPHAHILDRLANRLMTRALPPVLYGPWPTNLAALPPYQRRLKEVFYTVFVSTSVAQGLIDLSDLQVAGDGTHLPTWAKAHGHKLCACDNRAKSRAPRTATAPAACTTRRPVGAWIPTGTATSTGMGGTNSPPIRCATPANCPSSSRCWTIIATTGALHRMCSVAYLAAMHAAVAVLGFRIQTASLDKAHDALALYRLGAEHWHLDSVIPLNERNTDHVQFAPPVRVTAEGVPLCRAEAPMIYQGFCAQRMRLKGRCPLAAHQQALTDCPHFARDCADAAYGRTVYTYPQENYRLFSRLRRGSPRWELQADRRSCAERSVKRKKLDFRLDQPRMAGRERWFFRVMLAALCQHLDAWSSHAALDD